MDVITLKRAERRELNRWVRGQSRDAAQARRARLILLLADGERCGLIRDRLDCDTNFIGRWKSRFVAERLAGLYSRHSGRMPDKGSERQEARILKWTTQRKPARWLYSLEQSQTFAGIGRCLAHDHCTGVGQTQH